MGGRRGVSGGWLALVALFLAQAGVEAEPVAVVTGPSQGAIPLAQAASPGSPQAASPGSPQPSRPAVIVIDGGDPAGVDAVARRPGVASASPMGGGGGGGGSPVAAVPPDAVPWGPWGTWVLPPVASPSPSAPPGRFFAP